MTEKEDIKRLKEELSYHLALCYAIYRIDKIKVIFTKNNMDGYIDTGRCNDISNLKYIKKITGKTAFFMKSYLPYGVFKLMPELSEKDGNITVIMRGCSDPYDLKNPAYLENIMKENKRLEKMLTGKGMGLPLKEDYIQKEDVE